MRFPEIDYRRFDYWAIVTGRGMVTIEASASDSCRKWLLANQYEVTSFDFRSGISDVVAGLGEFLRWEYQFGYRLSPESRNLNALRDGYFGYPVPNEGGAVTIFKGFEQAWIEDEEWIKGLLSIGSEFSLIQLSVGRRYFVVVEVSDRESAVIGRTFDEHQIPYPYSPHPYQPWQ
jgi:hypothetical protein